MTDPSDRASILATASEGAKEASLHLLERLIAAGKAGPEAVDGIVRQAMVDAGCETTTLSYDPRDVPIVDEFAAAEVASAATERCITGRIAGHGGGRSLLLFAHPDMEDFGREPAWQGDPYDPSRRNSRLFGWGVADDLAGLAIMVQSIKLLRETGMRPRGDVTLISAPSKKHRRGISAALHEGIEADAAVYLHPAESGRGLDEIKAFAPGQLEFMITVQGRAPETSEPAHTAFVHMAVNPFDKALIIADALQSLDAERGRQHIHPRLQAAIGRSANLMLSHCEFGASNVLSRVAETCRLGGALTLVPGEALEDVMKHVEATVLEAAERDPWLAENPPLVTWLSGVTAAETPDEAPLYQTVAGVLRDFGADPEINPLHTSSDIRNPIVQKGIPTVGFGPLCGGLTMSDNADEWVDIDDFVRAIAATAEIILTWCGTEKDSSHCS